MAMTTHNHADSLEQAQARIEHILNEAGPFLPLADAARQARVPLPTLSDAVRNKRVKSLRLFGKAYVRLDDVKAYLAQSRAAAGKQTWSEMVAEVTQIGDERSVPHDYSSTFRKHLYGDRVSK